MGALALLSAERLGKGMAGFGRRGACDDRRDGDTVGGGGGGGGQFGHSNFTWRETGFGLIGALQEESR